jgi:hypothetical protein
LGLAAAVVLAGAAAFLLFQAHAVDPAPARSSPAPAATLANGKKPTPVIDLDALSPSVPPGGQASASATASGAARSQRTGTALPHRTPATAAAAKPGAVPRKHDDELDVGY